MTITSKFSQLVLVQMLCRHFSRSSVWSLFGMRDAYLRVAHDIPLHPVGTGEQAILHGAGASGAGQMVGQRLLAAAAT